MHQQNVLLTKGIFPVGPGKIKVQRQRGFSLEREHDKSTDFVTRLQPLCQRAADSLRQLGWRVVFAESCTAGLVSAALGSIPGISEYLCGSAVTYRNQTKQDWLGIAKERLVDPGPVSQQVVGLMARGALSSTTEADLALAITGHLGPDAPLQLDGLVHIGIAFKNHSINDETGIVSTSRVCRLQSDQRGLRQQEAAHEVLATLVDTLWILDSWKKMRQGDLEKKRFSWEHHFPGLQAISHDSTRSTPGFLFPGSFDPWHDGHQQMSSYAKSALGAVVEYELSIENVDKPGLAFAETLGRLAQFICRDPIWLTQSSTFEEKARLFPGTTFLVGVDTISRVADPKYYQSESAHRQAIEVIASSGCRFLVFGRLLEDKVPVVGRAAPGFYQLEDLMLAEDLKGICTQVPRSAFRHDISSSELRSTRPE